MTKSYINADLTFKSRTPQGTHVNSLPPDGVDFISSKVTYVALCIIWYVWIQSTLSIADS